MSKMANQLAVESAIKAIKLEEGAELPKPTHYLARDGDKYTPLIPIDELPEYISIVGVPTYVTQEDLLKAKGTGCFPDMKKCPVPYEVTVQQDEVAGPEMGESDDGDGMNVPSNTTLNARLAAALLSAKKARSKPENRSFNTSSNQRYNPTTPGVLGQKVYCTHWMRTGECDFTQQGCMFVHCMPDLDTLELLGFRAYPRWFREMPRDFQVMNSKEFNEAGLDPHRGTHWRGGMRVTQQQTPTSPAQGGNFGGMPQQQATPAFTHNRFGSPNGYSTYTPGQGFVPRAPQGQPTPAGSPHPAQSLYAAQGGQPQAQHGQPGRMFPSANAQGQHGPAFPPGLPGSPAQLGMPFGRPFVPGISTSASSKSPAGIFNTPGSDAMSSGVGSSTVSDYHRRNSIFSANDQDNLPETDQFKPLTPMPQTPRTAAGPPSGPSNAQKPQRRSLFEGAPPSPEPVIIKRFTDPKFQKSKATSESQRVQGQGRKGSAGQNGKGNSQQASRNGKNGSKQTTPQGLKHPIPQGPRHLLAQGHKQQPPFQAPKAMLASQHAPRVHLPDMRPTKAVANHVARDIVRDIARVVAKDEPKHGPIARPAPAPKASESAAAGEETAGEETAGESAVEKSGAEDESADESATEYLVDVKGENDN